MWKRGGAPVAGRRLPGKLAAEHYDGRLRVGP